jgi:hypothetical protein
MNLPSLSELSYEAGDVVWANVGWRRQRRPRRAVVKIAQPCELGDYRHDYMVEFADGRTLWVYHNDLRPYEAVDQLADVLCCGFCGKRPADCHCMTMTYHTIVNAVATDSAITMTTCEIASNFDDPVTLLGDLVRNGPLRRPLSLREKHRRRRRDWLAKRSRRRNRSQR